MEKRKLGNTGIDVTVLGYGSAELRGPRSWNGRPITDDEAERVLNAVLDAGINLVDTCPDYGLAETYIGRFISHRRDEYYLASKCGCTIVDSGDHDDYPHYFTHKNVLKNIDDSLRIMKTDYLDLWQPHTPSVDQMQEHNLVEVMQEAKQQGKVRHVGISSVLPHNNTFIPWGVFESFQIPYSALERREENIITAAARSGAGTIIRGGVAQGQPGVGLGNEDVWKAWKQANLDERCEEGESPTAFLLRFTITHPDVHTTIVGTKNLDQLAENRKTIEKGPLSEEVYEEAKRRLDQVGQIPEPSPSVS